MTQVSSKLSVEHSLTLFRFPAVAADHLFVHRNSHTQKCRILRLAPDAGSSCVFPDLVMEDIQVSRGKALLAWLTALPKETYTPLGNEHIPYTSSKLLSPCVLHFCQDFEKMN